MSWEWVVFALGLALMVCSTVIGGIYLNSLKFDRRRKDEEYKQLKELLEKQQEQEKK